MRRRDLLALVAFWGLLLAGLAWALATQARWVGENKPIQAKPPTLFQEEPRPPEAAPRVRVIGPISPDTREALRRGLRPRPSPSQDGAHSAPPEASGR